MYQIPVHESHPPALKALQRLMEQALTIDGQLRQRVDWTKRTLERTRPSSWTSQIEHALDKPDVLETLRKERREALISGDALLFGFYALNERFQEIQKDMFGAIATVVEQLNGMTMHHPDEWLRPILMNAVLQAEEIRRRRQSWSDDSLPNRHDADRDMASLSALKSAFEELSAFVKAARVYTWDNRNLEYSLKSLYPTVGAVTPESLGRTFKREEMREVWPQLFVDTVNTEHPALRKLADLMSALDQAIKRTREAHKALRSGEKGKVNERQYSARLISILDNPNGGCGSYGPEAIKAEQEKQKQARLYYQSARVVLYAEIVAADELRRQVLSTMREAIVECETLEAEIACDARATTDKLFTRRLALINCLAADVQVRATGRELQEYFTEYKTDLTDGKANRATEDAYHEIKRYYDSFKPRPETAVTTRDGNNYPVD